MRAGQNLQSLAHLVGDGQRKKMITTIIAKDGEHSGGGWHLAVS